MNYHNMFRTYFYTQNIYIILLVFIFLFVIRGEPFLITIILIATTLRIIWNMHSLYYYHFPMYLIIIIYLGGLLILFLYLTRTLSSFDMPHYYFILIFTLLIIITILFFYREKLYEKDININRKAFNTFLCFSNYSNSLVLTIVLILFHVIFFDYHFIIF